MNSLQSQMFKEIDVERAVGIFEAVVREATEPISEELQPCEEVLFKAFNLFAFLLYLQLFLCAIYISPPMQS